MRLLFVNSSLTDGGSERAMVRVANQMAEFGHDVYMLLVRDKKQVYQVDSRIKLIHFSYSSSSKIKILIKRIILIRRYVRVVQPDCVISFMWDINVMTLAATLGLGSRVVVSERAFPRSKERNRLAKYLEAVFYCFAGAIVYQTEGARKYCPVRLKSSSFVIPNVVAAPDVPPYKGRRTKRVVSVGRLTEQKNHAMLLHAFAEFCKLHEGYRLQIFGDGELRTELAELASNLHISEKVDFCGFVSDISSQINDASMFVLSSNFEGISNAMTEAMALGLPVICTDCPVGGAAMIINDGINGLLVPVGDSHALSAAMSTVADSEQLAQQLSINAREVVKRYSAERLGRMWEGVIRGC